MGKILHSKKVERGGTVYVCRFGKRKNQVKWIKDGDRAKRGENLKILSKTWQRDSRAKRAWNFLHFLKTASEAKNKNITGSSLFFPERRERSERENFCLSCTLQSKKGGEYKTASEASRNFDILQMFYAKIMPFLTDFVHLSWKDHLGIIFGKDHLGITKPLKGSKWSNWITSEMSAWESI